MLIIAYIKSFFNEYNDSCHLARLAAELGVSIDTAKT